MMNVNEMINAMVNNDINGIAVDNLEFDVNNCGRHAAVNINGFVIDEDAEGKKHMRLGDVGVAAYKEDKYVAKKAKAIKMVMDKAISIFKKFEDECKEKNMNLYQLCAEYGYSNDTVCDCIDLWIMAMAMSMTPYDSEGYKEAHRNFAKKYAAVFSMVMKETFANAKATMFSLTTGREIMEVVQEVANILVEEDVVKE